MMKIIILVVLVGLSSSQLLSALESYFSSQPKVDKSQCLPSQPKEIKLPVPIATATDLYFLGSFGHYQIHSVDCKHFSISFRSYVEYQKKYFLPLVFEYKDNGQNYMQNECSPALNDIQQIKQAISSHPKPNEVNKQMELFVSNAMKLLSEKIAFMVAFYGRIGNIFVIKPQTAFILFSCKMIELLKLKPVVIDGMSQYDFGIKFKQDEILFVSVQMSETAVLELMDQLIKYLINEYHHLKQNIEIINDPDVYEKKAQQLRRFFKQKAQLNKKYLDIIHQFEHFRFGQSNDKETHKSKSETDKEQFSIIHETDERENEIYQKITRQRFRKNNQKKIFGMLFGGGDDQKKPKEEGAAPEQKGKEEGGGQDDDGLELDKKDIIEQKPKCEEDKQADKEMKKQMDQKKKQEDIFLKSLLDFCTKSKSNIQIKKYVNKYLKVYQVDSIKENRELDVEQSALLDKNILKNNLLRNIMKLTEKVEQFVKEKQIKEVNDEYTQYVYVMLDKLKLVINLQFKALDFYSFEEEELKVNEVNEKEKEEEKQKEEQEQKEIEQKIKDGQEVSDDMMQKQQEEQEEKQKEQKVIQDQEQQMKDDYQEYEKLYQTIQPLKPYEAKDFQSNFEVLDAEMIFKNINEIFKADKEQEKEFMKMFNEVFKTPIYKDLIEPDISNQIKKLMEEKGQTIKGTNLAKDQVLDNYYFQEKKLDKGLLNKFSELDKKKLKEEQDGGDSKDGGEKKE